jgi:hypothetical protein
MSMSFGMASRKGDRNFLFPTKARKEQAIQMLNAWVFAL